MSLRPSNLDMIVHCQGSVALTANIVEEETLQQQEGTAAHYVCERILHSYTDSTASVLIADDLVGQTAPNGILITEEMWEAATIYTNDILELCNHRGLLRALVVEQKVPTPDIHPDMEGTPDCWAYDPAHGELYLWDYKYGHRRVEVFENYQLTAYITGILRSIGMPNPLVESEVRVICRIVQPRCYDGKPLITEWRVRPHDLRPLVNTAAYACAVASMEGAQCNPGTHCKDCIGAAYCSALQNKVMTIADHAGDPVPITISDSALAYELSTLRDAAVILQARLDALEVDAEHRITNGGVIPGWSLQQGYGRNAWNHDKREIVALGQLMGVDLLDEPKLLTPSKAVDKLKKNKVDPSVISSYYSKPRTSLNLVQDDGKTARQLFSKGGF
jgi:hypothetical protein